MEIKLFVEIFVIILAIFYLVIQVGLVQGIKRLRKIRNTDQPLASVIVAARNEEVNIGNLLQCLLNQTYKNFEIIIVDDRSTDRTKEIITEFQRKNSIINYVHIESLTDDMPAKKNALRAGIQASKGEILCFTDADCSPPPKWIEELVGAFTPDVGLVAGYSPYIIPSNYHNESIFKIILFSFITYEEMRAAGWSAGSIGWNLGWLCTGRNLAYRKKVYDEVGGFDKIKMSISGDDDLFLQLVRKQTQWKIQYITSGDSFVATTPPINWQDFVEQRKRHFSAAKFFSIQMMTFFSFYHFANLILLISPFIYILGLFSTEIIIITVCTKLISDSILFTSLANIFKGNKFRFSFIFMEVLYVLYNIFIGTLGLFKKFEWKKT